MPAVPIIAAVTGASAAIGTTVAAAVGLGTVGTVAATAIGSGIIAGATTAVMGGDASDVLESAVIGGVTSYVGGTVAPAVASAVTEATGSAIAGSVAGNVAATAVTGGDAEDILASGLLGGIGAAVDQAKLDAAEEFIQGVQSDGYNPATSPTDVDILDAIASENPVFVPPDTTFTPDYSLSSLAPVIDDMGAQGIQVPTIQDVVDVLSQPVDYSLPAPNPSLGLTMPTIPNLDSMGGGQGISVPVSGGTLTESGVIPIEYTPALGDQESFINQPAPTVDVVIPEVQQTPMTQEELDRTLAVADVVKTISGPAVSALIANDSIVPDEQITGFGIVPIPADWRSPEYNMAFTPSAPIDFGTRELLRGTQWESPSVQAPNAYTLSNLINTLNYQSQPFVQNVSAIPQAPMQMPEILDVFRTQNTVGINDTIGNLNGTPVSIADIIAGIQSGQNYSS